VAAVELTNGTSIDAFELMDFVRQRLGLRAPRRIILVDALPRTAEGKLLRRAVLSIFERSQ
jgi:acyl-coenzyme A synthetase/AMP-(fatty) acid ligase